MTKEAEVAKKERWFDEFYEWLKELLEKIYSLTPSAGLRKSIDNIEKDAKELRAEVAQMSEAQKEMLEKTYDFIAESHDKIKTLPVAEAEEAVNGLMERLKADIEKAKQKEFEYVNGDFYTAINTYMGTDYTKKELDEKLKVYEIDKEATRADAGLGVAVAVLDGKAIPITFEKKENGKFGIKIGGDDESLQNVVFDGDGKINEGIEEIKILDNDKTDSKIENGLLSHFAKMNRMEFRPQRIINEEKGAMDNISPVTKFLDKYSKPYDSGRYVSHFVKKDGSFRIIDKETKKMLVIEGNSKKIDLSIVEDVDYRGTGNFSMEGKSKTTIGTYADVDKATVSKFSGIKDLDVMKLIATPQASEFLEHRGMSLETQEKALTPTEISGKSINHLFRKNPKMLRTKILAECLRSGLNVEIKLVSRGVGKYQDMEVLDKDSGNKVNISFDEYGRGRSVVMVLDNGKRKNVLCDLMRGYAVEGARVAIDDSNIDKLVRTIRKAEEENAKELFREPDAKTEEYVRNAIRRKITEKYVELGGDAIFSKYIDSQYEGKKEETIAKENEAINTIAYFGKKNLLGKGQGMDALLNEHISLVGSEIYNTTGKSYDKELFDKAYKEVRKELEGYVKDITKLNEKTVKER